MKKSPHYPGLGVDIHEGFPSKVTLYWEGKKKTFSVFHKCLTLSKTRALETLFNGPYLDLQTGEGLARAAMPTIKYYTTKACGLNLIAFLDSSYRPIAEYYQKA